MSRIILDETRRAQASRALAWSRLFVLGMLAGMVLILARVSQLKLLPDASLRAATGHVNSGSNSAVASTPTRIRSRSRNAASGNNASHTSSGRNTIPSRMETDSVRSPQKYAKITAAWVIPDDSWPNRR